MCKDLKVVLGSFRGIIYFWCGRVMWVVIEVMVNVGDFMMWMWFYKDEEVIVV